jgi:hypothetical protein
MIEITGNTYGVRKKLKAMGCKWSPARKCWTAATPELAAQAQAIVPKSKGHGGYGGGPRKCGKCGCRINYGVYCGKCEFGR